MIVGIKDVFTPAQRKGCLVVLFLMLVGTGFELLSVGIVYPLMNRMISEEGDSGGFISALGRIVGIPSERLFPVLVIGVICIYILKNVFLIFMHRAKFRFVYRTQRDMSLYLLDAYLHQDYLFHVEKDVSVLQTHINTDVNQFTSAFLALFELVKEGLVCIALFLYLVYTDWKVTISIFFSVFLILFLYLELVRKKMKAAGVDYRRATATRNSHMLQAFRGIKDVKMLESEDYFYRLLADDSGIVASTHERTNMFGQYPRYVMEAVCVSSLLGAMLVLYLSGHAVIDFAPTFSVLLVSAFRMMPSFGRISKAFNDIMFHRPSIEKMREEITEADRLNSKKEHTEAITRPLHFEREIQCNNITFRYPGNSKYVLKDISFTIRKNLMTAIIGPSGEGKSTLIDLLLGLLKPEKGEFLVDGTYPVTGVASWGGRIACIPQTIFLLNDTMLANVCFGLMPSEYDMERFYKALKDAQLYDFVKTLDKREHTEIGDNGIRLSGGQRQRLGIARALYRNPEILILDEATSALDNETEYDVMEAIWHLKGEITLVVVAHRLSTIEGCDVLYEVRDGRIRERSKQEVFGKT